MNNLPLVSILIPTYNQDKYISKAIEGALAQDYSNLEVIVMDDNSTDETSSVVANYLSDPRLKYNKNSVNLGRVQNYKMGLYEMAKGEWVINLDGDDYFTDQSFISRAINLIGLNVGKNIVFVQGGHDIKDETGKLIQTDIPGINGEFEVIEGKEYFLRFNHFSHMATLFQKKAAINLDFYRYDILSADIESFLRLSLLGNIILFKKSIGVWLQHGNNQSKSFTIRSLDENLLSFGGPYSFAKENRLLPTKELNLWEKRMVDRYLIQHFYLLRNQKKPVQEFLKYIWTKFPRLFFRISFLKGILSLMIK
jgi:glycosyltransferase involved in cell wall biosynthesis